MPTKSIESASFRARYARNIEAKRFVGRNEALMDCGPQAILRTARARRRDFWVVERVNARQEARLEHLENHSRALAAKRAHHRIAQNAIGMIFLLRQQLAR
jgi:hypothetical protein